MSHLEIESIPLGCLVPVWPWSDWRKTMQRYHSTLQHWQRLHRGKMSEIWIWSHRRNNSTIVWHDFVKWFLVNLTRCIFFGGCCLIAGWGCKHINSGCFRSWWWTCLWVACMPWLLVAIRLAVWSAIRKSCQSGRTLPFLPILACTLCFRMAVEYCRCIWTRMWTVPKPLQSISCWPHWRARKHY